jgi:hypothetical protein
LSGGVHKHHSRHCNGPASFHLSLLLPDLHWGRCTVLAGLSVGLLEFNLQSPVTRWWLDQRDTSRIHWVGFAGKGTSQRKEPDSAGSTCAPFPSSLLPGALRPDAWGQHLPCDWIKVKAKDDRIEK